MLLLFVSAADEGKNSTGRLFAPVKGFIVKSKDFSFLSAVFGF